MGVAVVDIDVGVVEELESPSAQHFGGGKTGVPAHVKRPVAGRLVCLAAHHGIGGAVGLLVNIAHEQCGLSPVGLLRGGRRIRHPIDAGGVTLIIHPGEIVYRDVIRGGIGCVHKGHGSVQGLQTIPVIRAAEVVAFQAGDRLR